MRPRAVEEGDRARFGRIAHVKEFDTGRGHTMAGGLVGYYQQVAHHVKRVGAHLLVRQLVLENHLRLRRVGDIDNAKILRG